MQSILKKVENDEIRALYGTVEVVEVGEGG